MKHGRASTAEFERLRGRIQNVLESDRQPGFNAPGPKVAQIVQVMDARGAQPDEHLQKLLAAPEELSGQPNLPEVVARLDKALSRIDRALSRIDRLIVSERPEIEIILANFREISDTLRELTANLKERPSDILFSNPPPKSEALK